MNESRKQVSDPGIEKKTSSKMLTYALGKSLTGTKAEIKFQDAGNCHQKTFNRNERGRP